MTVKKRKPQDAVIGNVKRLRAEVRALAAGNRALAARVRKLERALADALRES